MHSLSKQIATDGEGATTLIAVNVSGAKSEKQAKLVAKSVVSSSLVKAAVLVMMPIGDGLPVLLVMPMPQLTPIS